MLYLYIYILCLHYLQLRLLLLLLLLYCIASIFLCLSSVQARHQKLQVTTHTARAIHTRKKPTPHNILHIHIANASQLHSDPSEKLHIKRWQIQWSNIALEGGMGDVGSARYEQPNITPFLPQE